MGRQERCDVCSEHRLALVGAGEYDELLAAERAAAERVKRLVPAVEAFAAPGGSPTALRARARAALGAAGPEPPGRPEPAIVVGWWCERCGNVDMPQPCLGVCVWRPTDWVNLALYERRRELAEPLLCTADALARFLARAATVTARAGHEERNREALRRQARAALGGDEPRRPGLSAPGVARLPGAGAGRGVCAGSTRHGHGAIPAA
jgi:hypothetical protein